MPILYSSTGSNLFGAFWGGGLERNWRAGMFPVRPTDGMRTALCLVVPAVQNSKTQAKIQDGGRGNWQTTV